MKQLNDSTVESAIRDAQRPVLLELGAGWCPPCRALEPHLVALARERIDIEVATLDVDDNPDTAARLGVRALPTLVLFVDGRVAAQLVGAQSRARLDAWIDASLATAMPPARTAQAR